MSAHAQYGREEVPTQRDESHGRVRVGKGRNPCRIPARQKGCICSSARSPFTTSRDPEHRERTFQTSVFQLCRYIHDLDLVLLSSAAFRRRLDANTNPGNLPPSRAPNQRIVFAKLQSATLSAKGHPSTTTPSIESRPPPPGPDLIRRRLRLPIRGDEGAASSATSQYFPTPLGAPPSLSIPADQARTVGGCGIVRKRGTLGRLVERPSVNVRDRAERRGGGDLDYSM